MKTKHLPILSQSPKLKYKIDLNKVNFIELKQRLTISGTEKTLIVLIPPKGCGYNCNFCSIKNIVNPNFPVKDQQGIVAAKLIAEQLKDILRQYPAHTLKLFNAGNILYGTERSKGELHEQFWIQLINLLNENQTLKVVEIEVRIDEFVEHGNNPQSVKEILRQRIIWLSDELRKIGKVLRCILPLEYIESDIISQQKKFPRAFSSGDKGKGNVEQAIDFMRQHEIEWLSYAMLGGRLTDRTLTSEEAITSAAHTVLFGLEHGAREVIINSQYLDPVNLWEQNQDGIQYYIPTEKDMWETLKLIVSGLAKIGVARVRLTTDKEDIIEGTIGPNVNQAFRQLILNFNNAPDQIDFFAKQMQNMKFNNEGQWINGLLG